MKDPDAYLNHGHVTPRQMLLCRVVAGLMGLAFFVGVMMQISSGQLRYAVIDEALSGRRSGGTLESVSVQSTAGLVFAFLSFGMMGLGALIFALKPTFFANPKVVVAWIFTILVGFVLLRA